MFFSFHHLCSSTFFSFYSIGLFAESMLLCKALKHITNPCTCIYQQSIFNLAIIPFSASHKYIYTSNLCFHLLFSNNLHIILISQPLTILYFHSLTHSLIHSKHRLLLHMLVLFHSHLFSLSLSLAFCLSSTFLLSFPF